MSARELAWRIASEAFGEGAARNAFAENVEGHLRLYERAAHEAGRREGIEEAAAHHEEMAIGALARNHVGSTNDERRDNRAIADWHTTAARLIRALLQRPGGECPECNPRGAQR